MKLFRRAALRLRAIVGRGTLDDDMQEEMRQHLDRATQRFMARGMSRRDAELAARREFGNVSVLQEEARDARGGRWVDDIVADARFARRYFARHKATTALIVVVLALGTGANTLIFSVFQAHFVRPAPAMPDDAAFARIVGQERATRTARWQKRPFSYPELQALARHREIFSDVAAWTEDFVVLGAGDSTGARNVGAQFVTSNYFRMFGVGLAVGQGLVPARSDAPDMTAVMSHTMASLLYGNAADAVGRSVLVNEVPVRIVGVAPARFQGPMRNMDEPALWIPLSARADIERLPARWLTDDPSLFIAGRVAPGVSHEQGTALARQVVNAALPDSATRVGLARTAWVGALNEPLPGADAYEVMIALGAIIGIGILILLVACTNVSSLMVAAAVGRRHEIAVRLSLGASRWRIVRQMVTESTVLALAGATLGLVVAWWVLMYMMKTEVDGVNLAPDIGTFAFVLAMAVATGVLFGLSPALHATGRGVATALRDSGTGASAKSGLQRALVATQIMLSQPLLVVLGVMLTLVMGDYKPLAGEMSSRVITATFRPLENMGAPSQRKEAVEALIPRIAERPGVVGAVPAADGFDVRGVFAPDRQLRTGVQDTVPTIVNMEATAPGWFALVDVPIILGRDVSLADTAAAERPVVISSDLARSLWGGGSPIGRTLVSPPLQGLRQDSITMTVVGVYDATRRLPGMTFNAYNARTDVTARVYTAHGKLWRKEEILVRTRGPAEPFLPELQRFVRSAAPSLPVASMRTLEQLDRMRFKDTLQMALLCGGAGAVALLLASLGLYGVVSLAVRQRTREIGIRIAVGAHPARVARMFLASGMRVSTIALVVGLPMSIAGLRVAVSQGIMIAPGVSALVIGIVIALVLLAVAAVATWLPARRAARVDPATTLRVE